MEQIIENTNTENSENTEEDSGQYIRLKVCNKCKIERDTTQFFKDKSKKDGFHTICKICRKEYQKEYYEENKDRISEQHKQYNKENKDKIAEKVKIRRLNNIEKVRVKRKEKYQETREESIEYSRRYNEENKDKIKEARRLYYLKNSEDIKRKSSEHKHLNRDRYNALSAKRNAQKLNATPKWLTKDQLEEINDFYIMAKMFQIYTGLKYHVDHIIPLQGLDVCGLHVPWNLQILEASENISKGNREYPDELPILN